MIEEIIKDYLKTRLDVRVLLEYPDSNANEERFVVIEKTGSNEANGVKSATIAIKSVADSLYKAAVLNKQVKGAMREIVTLDEVSGVSVNSDYNYTDTQTKQYRYQAVFSVSHY